MVLVSWCLEDEIQPVPSSVHVHRLTDCILTESLSCYINHTHVEHTHTHIMKVKLYTKTPTRKMILASIHRYSKMVIHFFFKKRVIIYYNSYSIEVCHDDDLLWGCSISECVYSRHIADGTEGFHTFLTGETLTQQVYTLIHKRILFIVASAAVLPSHFFVGVPERRGIGSPPGFSKKYMCPFMHIIHLIVEKFMI